MPTYSYVCDACGKSFEKEQRISEDPLKKCALCGKAKARRQIVSGNFILKGGGWYSDGYGASGGGGSASKSSAPKSEAPKSEAPKKTETKSSSSD
jgi:putative FmdB family regulatory protein